MSEIPNHVDVLLLGTSLTNSIIAAACSRIGKSVLHLDKNNYYGDDWASFTFQQLIDWIRLNHPNDPSLDSIDDELINKSRLFCIDLAPRLVYSNGSMVDLLVQSNVSRYHEFKTNIRLLSLIDDDIHIMPCRRNEVFTSPLLSNLADKRRLMKFIEMCVAFSPGDEAENRENEISKNLEKPILAFLEERGLNSTLCNFIINSIAMVRPGDSTELACKRIKKFIIATEKYGKSPFLFPIYGCGEFPQSFCRLSAVFGGLYCLSTKIDSIDVPNSKIKFSEYTVKGDSIVMDYNFANESNLVKPLVNKLSRAVLITNKSIVFDENEVDNRYVSFLRIAPSDNNAELVFVLETNSSALVCPKDLNILYLWTKASSDQPQQDLRPTVDRIFKNDTSGIVWQFYYQQLSGNADVTRIELTTEVPKTYVTNPPCDDIDYSTSIKEAEQIFKLICPDEEFLPRAPDPEEIISL